MHIEKSTAKQRNTELDVPLSWGKCVLEVGGEEMEMNFSLGLPTRVQQECFTTMGFSVTIVTEGPLLCTTTQVTHFHMYGYLPNEAWGTNHIFAWIKFEMGELRSGHMTLNNIA